MIVYKGLFTEKYHRSIPWIKKQIFEYEPIEKVHNPREVVIVCDATFYGKKKDELPLEGISLEHRNVIQRYIIMHPRLEAGKDLQKYILIKN